MGTPWAAEPILRARISSEHGFSHPCHTIYHPCHTFYLPGGHGGGGSHGASWGQNSSRSLGYSLGRRANSAMQDQLRCWFYHPCHTICHPGGHGKGGPTDHHGDRTRFEIVSTPHTAEPILRARIISDDGSSGYSLSRRANSAIQDQLVDSKFGGW